MIKVCKQNDAATLEKAANGKIDKIKLSTTNLVDDIILHMHRMKLLDKVFGEFPDKRKHNTTVPFPLIMALSVAAKMKTNTSLTDIPYAITDHRVIGALGYNLVSDKDDFMKEGTLRHLIGKYTADELFAEYNKIAYGRINDWLVEGHIHILDCTKLEVNLSNTNYEESGVGYSDGKTVRGYKLATLRSIINDTGMIRDIRFGKISEHDLSLSYDMLLTTPVFHPGDKLINDRGFISRELINSLKTDRGVDVYVPLRKNMQAYEEAILLAKHEDNWFAHPNKARMNQKISGIIPIGSMWRSPDVDNDVPVNACVVWDEKADEYFVFVTTNTSDSAKDIIKTYELRPEIEEDYRQLKDFWKLEDFKSTKLSTIAFHIVCTLLGYLFFQIYTLYPAGDRYLGKSLPVVLKNYVPKADHYYMIYTDDEFAIVNLIDLMKLYAECPKHAKDKFEEVLT